MRHPDAQTLSRRFVADQTDNRFRGSSLAKPESVRVRYSKAFVGAEIGAFLALLLIVLEKVLL